MFTLYRIAFVPPRNACRIGLLFTQKKGYRGAILATREASISKVEHHISDRFCAILWCSVNKYLARCGSKGEVGWKPGTR